MNERDDAELLRCFAERREEAAFAEVVRRHVDFVYACALRRVAGDAHLAQDVTQQVFCDVARRARELASHAVLAGWLHTSTRFAAAHAVRTEQRRRAREQAAFNMNVPANEGEGAVAWEALRPVLDQTMDELDERDRSAVILRFFEGRSFAQIGARLRLTDNAARMRVERALDKLHGLLARRGIRSTSAALGVALGAQVAMAAPAGLAGAVTTAALSGGVAAGATAAGVWATFMSMSKLQIGVAVAVAAVGAAGVVVQAETTGDLRAEAAALRREVAAGPALQGENLRLQRLAVEVAELRRDDAEMARLQEEAGVLRNRLQQMARAEEARAAAARAAQVFEISMLDQTPRPRFQARPQYPFEMRRAGVTGEVVVDFVVDANGEVKDAKALRSTRAEFEAAAVEAVSKWKFAAGKKGGQDVATHLQVPIVFTLDNPTSVEAPSASNTSGNPEREAKLRREAGERETAMRQAEERQRERRAAAESDGRVRLEPFVTKTAAP